MSEMIDRVTLALAMSGAGCASAAAAQSVEACPYKVCRCREAARMMIAATREPTEAMWLEPARREVSVNGVLPTGEECVEIWRAMNDVALAD